VYVIYRTAVDIINKKLLNKQVSKNIYKAPKKSRFADEIGERYGEIEHRSGKNFTTMARFVR